MKTLILIPAFGCDAQLYAPQIAVLEKSYRIQTIVTTADRFSAMVDDVLAQAPKKFAILGTSMGGRVALEVALTAPERVEGLCILGMGAGAVADQKVGLQRSSRIRRGERAHVIDEMAKKMTHSAGPRGAETSAAFRAMGNTIDQEALARQSDALAHRDDIWDELQDIDCLTLCLWGEHDQFSPPADGLRMAEAVQHGSYVELSDCGHFPTLEYPDEATEAIVAWLEDIDDVGEVED